MSLLPNLLYWWLHLIFGPFLQSFNFLWRLDQLKREKWVLLIVLDTWHASRDSYANQLHLYNEAAITSDSSWMETADWRENIQQPYSLDLLGVTRRLKQGFNIHCKTLLLSWADFRKKNPWDYSAFVEYRFKGNDMMGSKWLRWRKFSSLRYYILYRGVQATFAIAHSPNGRYRPVQCHPIFMASCLQYWIWYDRRPRYSIAVWRVRAKGKIVEKEKRKKFTFPL